ncbi:hypothetical protein B0E53_06207 [Micromonospora sp. MH33]|nr:hypothetical protein B0E53_06207 [Micromonospora sp. MH33]
MSTFSRTISSPTRALVRQCTRRNSSPTTYSRSESKVIEPCGTLSVRPSRLRPAPVGTADSGWMRGCTHTGNGSPYARASATRPSGSRRVTRSGPTGTTPRRRVGTG